MLFDDNGYPKFPMTEKDVVNYYTANNSFAYNKEIWILKRIENGLAILERDEGEEIRDIPVNQIFRIL